MALILRLPLRLPLLMPLLVMAGCSGGDADGIAAAVIRDRAMAADIERLPLEPLDAVLRGAVAQGLVSFDNQGRVQPALARRWIVTDDGMSYIFRVDGGRWADGSAADAAQIERLLTARIAELGRHGWARDLAGIAGVTAMTGNVIELRLSSPQPQLLELLAQPEMGLVRRGVGSGPLVTAAEASGGKPVAANRQSLTAIADEDAAQAADRTRTAPLTIAGTGPASGLVDFSNGRIGVLLGGRFQHLPLLAASNADGRAVRVDPVAGLFGIMVERPTGILAEPMLREALAMAIDRPRLLASYNLSQWREALTLVPEALPGRAAIGRPGWAATTLAARRAAARARIANWLASQSEGADSPPLRLALPEGAGARILFARLAADWRQIGVTVVRVGPGEAADLRLIDRVADYDSPLWYLARLSCGTARLCSEDADQQIDAGIAARTGAERRALFGEAEVTLTRFQSFIPLAQPVRWWLAQPAAAALLPNGRGRHSLSLIAATPPSGQ